MNSNQSAAILDAASEHLASLTNSASPRTWAQALSEVTDLSRTALMAVLFTVLALRCLDLLRDLVFVLAKPVAYFAMLVIATHWLGISPEGLRAILLSIF